MDIAHIMKFKTNKNKRKHKVTINYIYYIIMIDLIVLLYRKTDKLLMCILMMGIIGGVLSVSHMYIVKKNLAFEILNKDREIIPKNGKATIKVRAYNNLNILSPYIYVFIKVTDSLETIKYSSKCIMVEGKNYKDIELTYNAQYSGEARICISHIIVQDFFGVIATRLKQNFEDKYISVLPQSVQLNHTKSLMSTMNQRVDIKNEIVRQKGIGDFNYELSPYKQGDSMKLVHQKLLARRDIYMVREREEVKGGQRKYLIVLDPRCKYMSDRAEIIDKTLTTTISIIKDIVKREDEATLVYNIQGKWEHKKIYNKADITALIYILARYSGDYEDDYKSLHNYLVNNNMDVLYKIFITPVLEREYINDLEKQKQLGILTMMRDSVYEDTSIETWYLSDEYEVNRYV